MTRQFLAAAVALGVVGIAAAAPVPKAAPAPAPKAGATLQLATAKMSGEVIQMTLLYDSMVSKVVVQNGRQVVVTETVKTPVTQQIVLKGTKATTADGKEISEEDLAKKLADPTAVVQVPAGFDPEWKKLFADDVIFLEPARNAGIGRPGVIIRPGGPAVLPVIPVNPGGVVPLPAPLPIEK